VDQPPPVARRSVTSSEDRQAARQWWDADAQDYLAEHGDVLGDADFVWGPERLRESEARLLGEVAGRDVLEVGAGAAQCSRWLVAAGARPVALDLSGRMLAEAGRLARETGIEVARVQADAVRLPFADDVFDLACSAYGALPFVGDSAGVMTEVARVLRPGGRWVFSVTHPVRWCFLDDPGPPGLTAIGSYFDRRPYVEQDEHGRPTYVEHHRTLGDRVREIVAAGLQLVDLVEPEWPGEPEPDERPWGQWSRLRGELLPGTAIFVCRAP
jgi:SAM-dependent methyltransferase